MPGAVGGVPTPAPSEPAGPGRQGEAQSGAGGPGWLVALPRSPEAPYLALGLAATVVLVLAVIAYARRTRNL